MHELAKITGIRSDIEGTEMKVFVPEKICLIRFWISESMMWSFGWMMVEQ